MVFEVRFLVGATDLELPLLDKCGLVFSLSENVFVKC